jgi:hypothetical protein
MANKPAVCAETGVANSHPSTANARVRVTDLTICAQK